MIVNMKFLTITGPKDDIDRVTEQYLSKYEIQLENALTELKDVQNLRPFTQSNPYKGLLARLENYERYITLEGNSQGISLSYEEISQLLDEADRKLSEMDAQMDAISTQIAPLQERMNVVYPFRNLEYNIMDILNLKYIRFQFGRMPKEQYERFINYMYDELDVVFVKCEESDGYVWGVYFTTVNQASRMSGIFSTLHFEKTYLPKEYDGTPADIYHNLETEISNLKRRQNKISAEAVVYLTENLEKYIAAKKKLTTLTDNFDIRKLAAITPHSASRADYFILCGWASDEDAKALEKDCEAEEELFCYLEDPRDTKATISDPPTKLKNFSLVKPFEMYIQMYGLPNYNEIDPTLFVAISYSFIFGAMFGDVGQGLVLFLLGLLLYRWKKINLAGIIACCGLCSTLFGVLYGSVFGFEDWLPAMWLKPSKAMTNLPLIGRMNTIFVVAIAFGMFLILGAMVLQICNAMKQKDIERICFDTNGLAGFIFYGSFVAVILLFMTGRPLPATAVFVVMFLLPLLLIACKEPLTNWITKKPKLIEGSLGMFFTQTFFEMFEVLLSYFSNTLSFVRVGAFAVSHAAMMEVVLMLAGIESGSPNLLVVILGNIFVAGMEGLIVGIQVLRLEYYEMFSRFYQGNGKPFTPYVIDKEID